MRHTQENTEKNDAKWRAEHVFVQCSPPAVAFFARKQHKNRCRNKTQVQFRASKVPKHEFQHMPAKKSHHSARRQTHVLPTTTTATTITTTTPVQARTGSEIQRTRALELGFVSLDIRREATVLLPKTMTYSAAKHPKPSRYQGPAEQLLLCTALKHTTLMHPSSPVRSSAS